MRLNDYKLAAFKAHVNANKRDVHMHRKKVRLRQQDTERKHKIGKKAAQQQPYLEIPPEMTLTREYLGDVAGKRRYNATYADYYDFLAQDAGDPNLVTVAENVRGCHKHWFGDHYGMQQVFDVKNVFCCHNKFCSNCEHLKQASRLKRFTPILQELAMEYDFYHLVVTVPNCPGWQLKRAITDLLAGFTQLMRYFSGDGKIRGVDMQQYGYGGAIRCLECTVPGEYHPHIHALLLLKKDLPLYKTHINAYSYDHGIYKQSFSDLEILVQKMIYLIISGQKVTKDAIESLPIGYSCKLDRIEGGDWHEVFKYVTKLTKDDDDDTAVLSYEQFKTLYYALYRRKVMQGYGKLYNVAKDDSIDTDIEERYYQIIETLRLVESPVDTGYALDELMIAVFKGQITCISKRSVQSYLNELAKREREKTNSLDHIDT